MRCGQARKRDLVEPSIVRALRQAGAQVIRVSEAGAPDLLIAYRGQVRVLEVKTGKGRPTAAQQTAQQLGWPVVVVRTPMEALQAIGAVR